MHPSMLSQMINTVYHEQTENHKKLVHLRRFEIHDVLSSDDRPQPVAVPAIGGLVIRLAGWLGRMRPARVG